MKVPLRALLALVATSVTISSWANTLYVDVSNSHPKSPYRKWADAATSIQAALDVAVAGDQILVTNGVYRAGGRVVHGAMMNRVAATIPVTIQSVNGPQATVIEGNPVIGDSAVRCVYLAGDAVLNGFTLTQGATRSAGDFATEQRGGGVFCADRTATLNNCILIGNRAYNAGGGANDGTLNSCVLNSNACDFGGGVASSALNDCTVTNNYGAYGAGATWALLNRCTVSFNLSSGNGGGAASSTLNDCTLANNSASQSGGGGTSCTFSNCTIISNAAQNYKGGGVDQSTLYNCLVSSNSAGQWGAGAYGSTLNNCTVSWNATFIGGGVNSCVLTNCTVANNTAYYGSGGGAHSSSLTGCTVTGNSAYDSGGGALGGTLLHCLISSNWATFGGGVNGSVLTNCTLSGNSGGGAYTGEGGGAYGATLHNCLLVGNSSAWNGGGASASCMLNNCTLTGNSATGTGGGAESSTLNNCIAYYNTAPKGSNFWNSTLNFCCATPALTNGGNITDAPLFVNRAGGDFHLKPSSPCINAGNNAYAVPGSDLEGNPRVAFGTVDIGAYEAQQLAPYACTSAALDVRTNTALLNGFVVPNGYSSVAWFEWGSNTFMVFQTAPVPMGSAMRVVYVTNRINSLDLGRYYQYRLVVSNAVGMTFGAWQRFTTHGRVFGWGSNTNGETSLPPELGGIVGIAGGHGHTLALRPDGRVAAWGYNYYGEAESPPGLTNAIAIAAGDYHSVALRADGTLFSWGGALGGGQVVPAGLSNVVAIAAGWSHTEALKADGTVGAWGIEPIRSVPADLTNAVAIAAGVTHCLALRADGTVVAWGANDFGETNVPPNLHGIVAIGAGGYHCMAVKADGTLVTWGRAEQNTPSSNVAAVEGGDYHSVALRPDRTVTAWGWSGEGRTNVPVGLSNVAAVAAGAYHSLALRANGAPSAPPLTLSGFAEADLLIQLRGSDPDGDALRFFIRTLPGAGALYQCQGGARGALITTPNTLVTDPAGRVVFVPAPGGSGSPYANSSYVANDWLVDSVPAAIAIHIVAAPPLAATLGATVRPGTATLNGMVTPKGPPGRAWFEWGQRGSYAHTTSLIPLGTGDAVVRVTAGISNLLSGVDYQYRLVASNATGITYGPTRMFGTGLRVRAWGLSNFGQTNVPAGLRDVVTVAGGYYNSLALKLDGSVQGWGDYRYGQTNPPAGVSDIAALGSGGWYHCLAIKADGRVLAWGDNGYGQCNVPVSLTNAVEVAGGASHSLALKPDGTLVAWGDNLYGQASVPAGLSNMVAIGASDFYNLALKSDGTIVGWGNNPYGQATPPSDLSNVVAIAAGNVFALALKANGTVRAWGDNSFGQTAVPTGLSNVVAISAGRYHALAVQEDGTLVSWGLSSQAPPAPLANVVAVWAGDSHSLGTLDNSAPQALAQTVSGPANQDLMVGLTGFDADADVLSFRVTSLPATGTLYQYASGARGPAIILSGTLVTDSQGRLIFAPVPDGYGSPHANFSFNVTDGELDSAPATITVDLEGRPRAFTQPPTGITRTGAVLNGMALADGFVSQAWFEWGQKGALTNQTEVLPAGNGGSVLHLSAAISNLVWGTDYQYRLVVSNAAGLAQGWPQTLATGKRLRAWGDNSFGQTNVPVGLNDVIAVAAGELHNLAITSKGTIVAWGRNDSGQTNATGVSNVVLASVGPVLNVALKADGTVTAWPNVGYSSTNVPSGLSNVVMVSAGEYHGLALKADGTVAAWGSYLNGSSFAPMFVPAGLSNVVAIASGRNFALALRANGTVTAWGTNWMGETQVPAGLSNVVSIAAGSYHAVALKADGTVAAWGLNNYGQSSPPAELNEVLAMDAKSIGSLALKQDGTLAGWGYNAFGQLNAPAWLTDIAEVFEGGNHAVAMTSNSPPVALAQSLSWPGNTESLIQLTGADADKDSLGFIIKTLPSLGALYQYSNGGRGDRILTNGTVVTDAMGRVFFVPGTGELGNPYTSFQFATSDTDLESAPAEVVISVMNPIFGFTRPATAVGETGADLNGTLAPKGFAAYAWFEWGPSNTYGQSTPVLNTGASQGLAHLTQAITGLTSGSVIHFRLVASNASAVVYGMDQQFMTGGRAAAWGDNAYGQTQTPVGLGKVTAIAGGLTHSLALRTDGTMAAWGNNAYGQATVPTGLEKAVALAAGGFHNVALLSNRTVAAWGRNNYGQTTIPSSLGNVVGVAAGGAHSLALRDDGSVVAWGYNLHGETAVPPGLSNVVQVAAGWYHSVALLADGTVSAWGNNSYGQCAPQPGLSNVVWVGAGLYHTLALRSDGSVAAWGYNSSGQASVPTGLSNVVVAASGGSHNLALRADGSATGWGYNFYGQATVPATLSNLVALAGGSTHSLAIGPNHAPTALAQDVTGYVNSDLMVSLHGADPDLDFLGYKIASLPSHGSLFQYAGGRRGAQILSADTLPTDPNGRLIFAPAEGETGSPYTSLEFQSNDGNADSAPATIRISIVMPSAPTITAAASGWTTDGSFTLTFSGTTNATYRVWGSTNLVYWEPLGTATSLQPGWFQFVDLMATNWPHRFYKAGAP